MYKGIEIIEDSDFVGTIGLSKIIDKEIRIPIGAAAISAYISVLKYLIDYVVLSNPLIKDGQMISYYSWILKFIAVDSNTFDMYEADALGGGYVQGVDAAIKLLYEQELECSKHGVVPAFPNFSQKVVISKGVYEGMDLEAVRYPSPQHMSGWWLTTDLYDGNVKTLMSVHFYHIAFKRPDILKYLAFPFGYRFFCEGERAEVWLDLKVLE